MPSDGRDQKQNLIVVGWPPADQRGQIMKSLTSAQLFAAPKRAGKAKARLERAKLVIVAARGRAAETAQRSRNGAAVCGPAFNDAPSYRAAEAPIGREVQREVV